MYHSPALLLGGALAIALTVPAVAVSAVPADKGGVSSQERRILSAGGQIAHKSTSGKPTG